MITGLWHSWWYSEEHLVHSIRRFFALKSMRRQITHVKSSKKLLLMCVSMALSSTAAIVVAAGGVSGSEMMTGISWVWPLESVVITVVAVAEFVVTAIICTGLELLESLDLLLDERRTDDDDDDAFVPLPVALLSSAMYFLLNVLISILFGPCFSFITSSSAFRIFSAASLFDECKNFKACRNTGSNSTLAAIFSTFNIYMLCFFFSRSSNYKQRRLFFALLISNLYKLTKKKFHSKNHMQKTQGLYFSSAKIEFVYFVPHTRYVVCLRVVSLSRSLYVSVSFIVSTVCSVVSLISFLECGLHSSNNNSSGRSDPCVVYNICQTTESTLL